MWGWQGSQLLLCYTRLHAENDCCRGALLYLLSSQVSIRTNLSPVSLLALEETTKGVLNVAAIVYFFLFCFEFAVCCCAFCS